MPTITIVTELQLCWTQLLCIVLESNWFCYWLCGFVPVCSVQNNWEVRTSSSLTPYLLSLPPTAAACPHVRGHPNSAKLQRHIDTTGGWQSECSRVGVVHTALHVTMHVLEIVWCVRGPPPKSVCAYLQTCIHDSYRIVHVGKLIVSKYVAESINNWLQDVLATKAFINCIQIFFVHSWQRPLWPFCTQLMKAFVAETATYLLTINLPRLKDIAMSLCCDIRIVHIFFH